MGSSEQIIKHEVIPDGNISKVSQVFEIYTKLFDHSNTTINIENLGEVNSSIFAKQGNVKCDKYTNNENKVIDDNDEILTAQDEIVYLLEDISVTKKYEGDIVIRRLD